MVWGVATDCSLSLITEGLPWWPCGLRRCYWLFAVSHHWGPALMAVWSKALPLIARCLSPLRCLPWWPCGLRRCYWLLAVSHHWGPALMAMWSGRCHWLLAVSLRWGPALMAMWSNALPLTACCLSSVRAYPDGRVVWGVVTDCSLSLITEGLPWWLSGLRHCHWLLAASRHWGPTLMTEWSKALPLTARCLSPLSARPDGCLV